MKRAAHTRGDAGRSHRSWPAAALLLLFCSSALLLQGCPPPQGRVSYSPAREYAPDDYHDVLMRWTRRADIYDQLQSQAFIHATFKSLDYRRAYATAYAKIMDYNQQEAARLWAEESGAAAAWHEITFVMYTTERRWNDLERPDTVWKIHIASPSGAEVPPAAVTAVKELSPQMQRLLPHHSPFTRLYVLRFPRKDASGAELLPAAGGRVILSLVSGLGKAELAWEIAP